ncbi:MAG TPA: radical SAM protein [Ignavibacteriaceae bacterium]|nr:radical SAM protein [Ignavibacteriaceae bacterium]
MIAFGPIPSRRLGRSLGINNIPPKICSYSCVYCQIGTTNSMSIDRKEFYSCEEIVNEVSEKVKQLQNNNEQIDYLTFVPDGEPTLDKNLGREIDLLKPLGIKIAVITNSSLLWDENVRKDLMNADWVSVKIDTVDEKIWHLIDRPNGKLELPKIIGGIKKFAASFKGKLLTETMLVKEINDDIDSLQKTAKFIKNINPETAYILVPTRPPAEKFVEPPIEENINIAYQMFNGLLNNVELLISNEGTDFSYSSDAEKELLSILAVHPMRSDAVEKFLNKAKSNWDLIEELIHDNILKEIGYSGKTFIVKNIKSKT